MHRRSLPALFGLIAATGLSCKGSEPQVEPPPPLALDVVLSAGQTRAGVVTQASELIGGLNAKGRLGDIKIYNEFIEVLIGQPGVARGYNPYGGSILDADIVRPPDVPGRSAFGEVIVAADLFILNGESVQIVNDGQDGGAARVRVEGKVDDMPLFSAFFSELFGTEPYDLKWRVDYVLEPGQHRLRCEYELFNPGRTTIEIGLPAAGFIFDSARPFVEGYGFDPPTSEGTGAYYGALTEHVSYLYGALEASLSVVITQSGVVFAGLGDPLKVRARERIAYTHYLVVQDGDLSKAQQEWRAAVQQPEGVEISGRVVDDEGQPAIGARVHILDATRQDERDYMSRTQTDEMGRFSAKVLPGAYSVSAVTQGLTRSPSMQVEAAGASVSAGDLVAPAAGVLEYIVKDDEGRDLPVKLSVRRQGGGTPDIPARFGEPGLYYGLTRTVFAHRGRGQVALPAGDYDVFVSRGSEYEVQTLAVQVQAGQSTMLQTELQRSVATPGWVSTDTHVHAQLSPDSPDSYEDKVRAMVVEGLEVPVSTEHEAIGSFDPAIEALGLGDWINGITGSEVTTYIYGHFNAYPLVADPTKVGNGRIDWYGKPPAETFAAVRANAGQPFLQVNHPRAPSIGGYLSAMGYDRDTGQARRLDWSPDFDGLEVMNGCSGSGIQSADVKDWFSFLNQGRRVAAVGATDNHRAESGNMGLPRTYLRVDTDTPSAVDDDKFRTAFMQGRLLVSCGPFLTAKLGEAQVGDTAAVTGDLVQVDVQVQAPTWMSVDTVQLIVNGQTVKTQALEAVDGVLRFDGTLTASVSPGVDAWLIVETHGAQRHGIWARNRPSFAFTNPIFLDGDGDGVWRQP